ncbi:MAG: D-alanyl-D-alanine carboxypeptidase [Pseudobdellovibrio sp.]
MIKILSFLALSMLLFGCQPSDSNAVHLVDPISEKIIKFDQSKIDSYRKLPFVSDPTVSYCEANLTLYEKNSKIMQYSSVDDQTLHPAASLSKIYLTAFVIHKLGLEYQFSHRLKLKYVTDQVADVFLDSDGDPIYNIQKALYIMSILRMQGVRQIRHLTISPQTRIFLSVLNNPSIELDQVPISLSETIKNFKLIFNSQNWGPQTQFARDELNQFVNLSRKNLPIVTEFKTDTVGVSDTEPDQFDQEIIVHSSRINEYLKELNVNSNNYISDTLFKKLGGFEEFYRFQSQTLKIKSDQLIMFSGSGLPTYVDGRRYDNKTTCRSLIKALHYIKIKADDYNVNLGDLLLMPDYDQGTFDSQSVVVNHSVVLKTGRLFEVPTLNLAGLASTQSGIFAFVFLGHNFDNSFEEQMKSKRDKSLLSLFSSYGETPLFAQPQKTKSTFIE